tara:strand:+ start:4146 stop:4685 length:540 start_codon:yes stop_codon:yes gene_type:complete
MAKKKATEIIVYKSYYAKGTSWSQNPEKSYRYMECKQCGDFAECTEDTTAVTCNICCQAACDAPVLKQPKSERITRPKGWHFMAEYVDSEGNVYHKGVEQPNLYGKLDATVIEAKKRVSKKDKEKYKWLAASKISKLKKELAKTRWKKDKKVITKQITYFSRIVKGKLPTDYLERLYTK